MGGGNEGRGMEFQFTLRTIGLFFALVGNGGWTDVRADRDRRTSAPQPA